MCPWMSYLIFVYHPLGPLLENVTPFTFCGTCVCPHFQQSFFPPAKPANHRNRLAESRGTLDSQHSPSSRRAIMCDFKGNEFYFQILKTP